MFDLRVAFFQPIWRRIVTVIVCFGWGLFEYSNGATVWAVIFGAMGATGLYQFFFDWKDPEDQS